MFRFEAKREDMSAWRERERERERGTIKPESSEFEDSNKDRPRFFGTQIH